MTTDTERPSDFIPTLIARICAQEIQAKASRVGPPEPIGYLHIGHAKSIFSNFADRARVRRSATSRMDDNESDKGRKAEYVRSIMADVHWLVDDWADKQLGGRAVSYASDYFDRFLRACSDPYSL